MKFKPGDVKYWFSCNFYGDYQIGKGTRIGSFCDIGGIVGKNCLIQSFVFIPPGITIEDNCFIAPSVVFTNDKYPPSDKREKTIVRKGASIGARAVILPGLEIGENAMIGAGSVVTRNIPQGEIWAGNPARFKRMVKNTKIEYGENNIEGAMHPSELNWLYLTAKRMDSIVELGSLKGRSTYALLSGCKGTVHAVDNFKRGTYKAFIDNVGHFENLKVYKMDSVKAARKFKDNSIDMVFIDANHSYKSVRADINAWLPKVKKLICGHDYDPSWSGVVKAVNEKFGKIDKIKGIWFYNKTLKE